MRSEYIVVDDIKYTIDSESSKFLSSFYITVMLDDGKKYYVSAVEYDYVYGNINDEGYASAKNDLIANGIIESDEEYYCILSEIDGITK